MNMSLASLFIVVLAVGFPAAVVAEEGKDGFVLIVNKTNQFESLSRSRAKHIFLKRIGRWPWGAEVVPIDLPEGSPLRRKFVNTILGVNVEELSVYWIDQKVTRNLNPPLPAESIQAAKKMVAARVGAIAYIPESAVDDTVKVLRLE